MPQVNILAVKSIYQTLFFLVEMPFF